VEPMVDGGGDVERGGSGAEQKTQEIDFALDRCGRTPLKAEWQAQHEGEQDLNPGQRDPELVEEQGQLSIEVLLLVRNVFIHS